MFQYSVIMSIHLFSKLRYRLGVIILAVNINFNVALLPYKVYVWADQYCVEHSLANVIDNSIKYSEKGVINVNYTLNENEVMIKIHDQGIGISKDYQRHLFKDFSQKSAGVNRLYDGVGLGLALTKKYLGLINGAIKIHSEKGNGTQCQITLKAAV